ncbi:2-hydroxyacid dehydrogenase [Ruegeria sp. 2205SS24-7]|uniref:2-hydroxyacid dehydrogenase n=1 Tax=Ruegeria discodermiae TaxID=3064389 RepID=UPI0027404E51|nr:2-hydroxyacid dehydrogenase [Ruegeria sp. 2205SS24-7]MDP5218917.1 2-hydroxyacid dehydrogenase [Ruegeria sp. 2205SS24-7]
MTKPDILAVGSYAEYDQVPMDNAFTVWSMDEGGTPDHLPEDALASIRAIAFRGHSFLGDEIMDRFPNLGMIANLGVGYDTIDVAHAVSRGILVSNTPDVLTEDVADLGVGMMIAWSRGIPGAQGWIRSGDWTQHGEYRLQRKVSGKRVGIVGLGRIGRALAERLVPFNIDVSYFSRSEKDTPRWTYFSDISAMAEHVDVLFVCISGGPATAGIVGAETLAALGPDGLLVNISRGTTVDEAALLNALENCQVAGAALDVFLNEPNIDPRFLQLDNVLLQPHQSSGTIETRTAMGALQRENLAAFFAGRSLVTPVPECA